MSEVKTVYKWFTGFDKKDGKPEGELGPRYDKASADDALARFWESGWISLEDLQGIESNLRELFRTLGNGQDNEFEELLLYWMGFAAEHKPSAPDLEEAFDSLRRAVLLATGVSEPGELNSAHSTNSARTTGNCTT